MSIEEKKPKIIGKKISLAGDVDACGHCKEGDEFFKTKATTVGGDTAYSYHHIESEEGKDIASNIAEEAEADDGIYPIPAIKYCKTVKEDEESEPEEICDYIQGFNKNDWDEQLNYKKKNTVDEEIDELFGED